MTAEICSTALLLNFLVTMKETELENFSLRDISNLRTAC